jgi:acyl-coenzyme A synthetase/AMP-(fatty) acid ligase
MPTQALRATLPLNPNAGAAFARTAAGFVSVSEFRAGAERLASRLEPAGDIVNLCENRYQFLAVFAAAVLRGRTTLLPPSPAPAAVAELTAAHPGCVVFRDASAAHPGAPEAAGIAELPGDFVAVVGHTSGSTGKPAAHAKPWSGLQTTTALNAAAVSAAIGDDRSRQPWIVATVPPQHMYGLEMSVLLPLLFGFGIHGGRPLLPADVATALGAVPAPRVLVSTPVHLRTLVDSGAQFPDVSAVVSATAPLTQSLALRVERRFSAVLIEMFGSTETCVVATRRTARNEYWRAYPGIRFEPTAAGTIVRAPWLAAGQMLQDTFETHADGSFAVVGRHGDLIEVAGKRASLADLTRRLAALPGVRDAIVFQPPGDGGGRARRCAALVVAPGIPAAEIVSRFRQMVDPVFVPRPLVIVPLLPRNELGKLPLDHLLALLAVARDR